MKLEDKLLFACTRQNFLGVHLEVAASAIRRSALDWDYIYTTALEHGVAPLVYTNLLHCAQSGLAIPAEIMAHFQACFFQNMENKERRAEKLADALAFFHQASIDVMFIKGIALDVLVYRNPYLTTADDIDVVLRVRKEELSESEKKRIVSYLHGSKIEFDYYEHHDVVINGVLPVDFDKIWHNSSGMVYRRHEVFLMSSEDMLLTTCINSCRKRFFKLKSLADIAEITYQLSDLDWQKVVRSAQSYDCQAIVYTALLVTQRTLGCKVPDGLLGELGVSPARAALIRLIVGYGSRYRPLSSIYPFSGVELFGRQFDLFLLLSYTAYRGYQVRRKISLISPHSRRKNGHC
jgi:hypothetical protein